MIALSLRTHCEMSACFAFPARFSRPSGLQAGLHRWTIALAFTLASVTASAFKFKSQPSLLANKLERLGVLPSGDVGLMQKGRDLLDVRTHMTL